MVLIVSKYQHKSFHLINCIARISANHAVTSDTTHTLQRCLRQQVRVVVIDSFGQLGDYSELLRQLQCQTPETAVIVVAHQGCDAERILSLEMGAEDYMEYPYNPAQIQARIRMLLRRAHLQSHAATTADSPVEIGCFRIDNRYHRAEIAGKVLSLTATEFSLLRFLSGHADQVFSREQLLTSVWGYQYTGFEHTVASHINRLRSKLATTRAGARLVETVWGVGYKFNSHCVRMAKTA